MCIGWAVQVIKAEILFCGNTLDRPEASTWGLYQAKHYGKSLSPSNFGGELAKFIWCVFKDEY